MEPTPVVDVRVSEVVAGGHRVYARHLAAGRARQGVVVLVHGMVVAGRGTFPLARELAASGFLVHLPDLPGFGRSSKPARALDVAELARALRAWLDASAVAPAALVGNSFGTQVAAAAASHGAVSAVVLISPTIDRRFRGGWSHLLPPGRPGGRPRRGPVALLQRRLVDRLVPDEPSPQADSLRRIVVSEYLAAGPARALSTYRHALRDDLVSSVRRIQAPVTVVRGGADRLVSPAWADTVLASAPSGRLVEVRGADHDAQFHHARQLADAVAAALGSTPAPSAADRGHGS